MSTAELKERILKDLHIREDQYLNYAYEAGHAYLEARRESFYKGFPRQHAKVDRFIRRLCVSRMWWEWWMQEWQAVDSRFMRVTPRSLGIYLGMQKKASEYRVPPIDIIEQIIETAHELETVTVNVPTDRIAAEAKTPLNEVA